MKRITIIMLLGLICLAACTVDELSVAFDEPTRNSEGTIIDNYPYLWKHTYRTSTSKAPRLEFKTFDYTLPMFDNGGKVIVGNINGGITCLETSSGNEVWKCVLLEDLKYVADCPIIDYIISSTEEWIIINLGGFYFVKIDLKTGKKLEVCEPITNTTVTSRMIKDGDDRFFVTIKEQVYSVTTENMLCKPFSFNGEFYSHKKIYPFPFIKDNQKYYFVETVTTVMVTAVGISGQSEIEHRIESLCLINQIGDTLYKTELTNLVYRRNPVNVPILVPFIAEYNGDVYLFTNQWNTYVHDLYIFSWDSMKIVYKESFSANIYDANLVYDKIRYCDFYDDKLIIHVNKINQFKFNVNTKELNDEDNVIYGSHIHEGNIYTPSGNYLKIRDYNSNKLLVNIPINESDFEDSGTSDVYEHVIGKNSSNETIIVIIADNDIVCYAGL